MFALENRVHSGSIPLAVKVETSCSGISSSTVAARFSMACEGSLLLMTSWNLTNWTKSLQPALMATSSPSSLTMLAKSSSPTPMMMILKGKFYSEISAISSIVSLMS